MKILSSNLYRKLLLEDFQFFESYENIYSLKLDPGNDPDKFIELYNKLYSKLIVTAQEMDIIKAEYPDFFQKYKNDFIIYE